MMKSEAEILPRVRAEGPGAISPGTPANMPGERIDETYTRLTRLIERLHRRHLDMLRLELDRLGIQGINPAQALMLMRLEGKPVTVRDLVERGYYLGSNVSYNIKQLVKAGYVEQERSPHDRRSLRVSVTESGQALSVKLAEAESIYAQAMSSGADDNDEMQTACRALRRLEQFWSDRLRFDRL